MDTYARLDYNDKLNNTKKTDYYHMVQGEGVLMTAEDGEKIYKFFDSKTDYLDIADSEKNKEEISSQIKNSI